MWNLEEKGIRKERVLAMTPIRRPSGPRTVTDRYACPPDTVHAGAGALSFILGTHHAMVSKAFHGLVEPTALVVTQGGLLPAESAELLNLSVQPIEHAGNPPVTVHIGCERRVESSATSGPSHVLRTIALAATRDGTITVTVEPGWERILWDHQ